MITRNLKVFLIALLVSSPVWWGLNAMSIHLTEFFFVRELQTNPEIVAAYAAQRDLDQKLHEEYPLVKKNSDLLELPAQAVLSTYIKEDGTVKVLYRKNASTPLLIASLTKLTTALVALQNYSPDERVMITPDIVNVEGQAGQLKEREIFTVKDLLYVALIESSNDGAFALTKPLGTEQFIQKMNEEASRLGMRSTTYVNPTGLDVLDSAQGNYSTATDLTKLARYLLENYPQVFDIISQSQLNLYNLDGTLHHAMVNTDILLQYHDWPTKILGGKTGTTPKARQALLFVVQSPDSKGTIINVILGSENRFGEMEQLLHWILQHYEWNM